MAYEYNVMKELESVDRSFRYTGNREQAAKDEQQIQNEIFKFILDHSEELTQPEVIRMISDFRTKQQFTC
jgi:hypothetical protein